jgi:methanogenic corrinoid protein MtbC1
LSPTREGFPGSHQGICEGTRNRSRPGAVEVVIAGVAGELHAFPARLVADALDLAGYTIHFPGADVPTREIAITRICDALGKAGVNSAASRVSES